MALDNKAMVICGVAAITIAFLGAGGSGAEVLALPSVALGFLFAGLVFFLAGMLCVFQGLRCRSFYDGLSVKILLDDYWEAEPDEVKYSILYFAGEWEDHNLGLLEAKARWFARAMVMTISEVVVLVFWVVF